MTRGTGQLRWVSAAAFVAIAVAGCGGGSSAPPPAAPSGPDAAAVVEQLGTLFPVSNARDNTGSCKAAGCEQLITTDGVTVSEWPDEAGAAKWAEAMKASDARQAGRFVLTFNGDQDLTSDEARAAWTAKATELSKTS